METTKTHIEAVAAANGMTVNTVIDGVFNETEKLVLDMGGFKTAIFIMDNNTFNFTFEKVYNAATDKTSLRLPKIFKS
jgi:ABC-type uncharacterized transport system substrate-binding protein